MDLSQRCLNAQIAKAHPRSTKLIRQEGRDSSRRLDLGVNSIASGTFGSRGGRRFKDARSQKLIRQDTGTTIEKAHSARGEG